MATVKLNVGGTHIEVATDTLNKCEYFRAMLSKNWSSKGMDTASSGAAVFLDCDIDKFTRGVLDPLRYGKDIPEDCLEVADFYGVTRDIHLILLSTIERIANYIDSFTLLFNTLSSRYLTPDMALTNLSNYIDWDREQDPLIYTKFKLNSIYLEIDKLRGEIRCNTYKYKNILSTKLAKCEKVPRLSFTRKDIEDINMYYYLLYNNLARDDYINKNILMLTYTEHYKKLIDILETNFAVLETEVIKE